MNWWKINGILMIASSSLFAQIPRDSSYTLLSTVEKISERYPDKEILGVSCSNPETVDRKTISYQELDDRNLKGYLFLPKSQSKAGGILLIHGGGWRAGSPDLMFPMAERLAEAGYTVMVPEYRLSLEAKYPAALDDLTTALTWMKENATSFAIDSGKIVSMGCSAGGQLAALLGTTQSVKAIVDIDGILAFKHPNSKEGDLAAQWLGGPYEEIPEVWHEASALSHVNQQTPPTLFLASKYPRFLAGHQEYMMVLKKAGTYTEIKHLDGAPHSFWLLSPWFNQTVDYILNFLTQIFNQR